MSSDSEMSSIYQSSNDHEEGDFVDSEDEDIAVVYGQITPCQDEPLAEDDNKANGEQNEEADQASGFLAPFCQSGNSSIESSLHVVVS